MDGIQVFDHRRSGDGTGLVVDLQALIALARRAHPHCLAARTDDGAPLCSLTEIEISLISDAAIAEVHGDFMDDPTPTDVITFHHGEILISPETAERQRVAHGNDLQREVSLYAVHGLLHLAGHDDREPQDAARMASLQEEILSEVWAG